VRSIRVLATFGGFICSVMLIKGIYALVSEAPDTSPAALFCFALSVGVAVAFNVLLNHDSVTSWCASDRTADVEFADSQ
jgi:uncharacterized protein with GYD domain